MRYQPYSRYKDSGVEWIGEIPEGWSCPSLRRHVSIRNGADYKEFEKDEPGFPVYGSGGQFAYVDRFVHAGPSVLLGRKGTIDRPLYVDSPFWTVDTMFYCEISGQLEVKFLYFFCTTIPFNLYSTATALPSMTQSDYGSMFVPHPSHRVQAEISSFLDRETAKIDTLVCDYEDLIALLTEKRQALISHAVTRGLSEVVDANDPEFGEWCKPVCFRDSGVEWLGEIPEAWKSTRLKFCCLQVLDCPHETPEYSQDGEYLVVRTANISDGILAESEMYRVDATVYIDRIRRASLDAGDIVYSREGERWGHAALIPESNKFCLGQRMMQLKPTKEWHPLLLMWVLNSNTVYEQGAVETVGATAPHVNVETVANYSLAEPALREQSAIASFLARETTKIDILVRETRDVIGLLKEHRSALITAAVTGKINVEGS